MKNIFKIFTIGLLISTVSCEDYSEDLNTDPNNFTDAPGSLVIGQAELEVITKEIIPENVTARQINNLEKIII